MLTEFQLNTFLHFACLPDMEKAQNFANWLTPILEDYEADNEHVINSSNLVARGLDALRNGFQDIPSGEQVIPLSGGMDSRGILANLLEHISASEINTVTFGLPGALDFEIGNLVAKTVGTKHISIDLSQVKIHTDELVKYSRIREIPIWLFDNYYNFFLTQLFDKGCTFWIGFMGDPIAGSHLTWSASYTWREAQNRFVRKNQFCRSVSLTVASYDPVEILPNTPLMDSRLLGYDEQLDFCVRQQSYITNIVLQANSYRTPYLSPDWVRFMLTLPEKYRLGKKLYIKLLTNAFPQLFSLPVTNAYGLRVGAPRWKRGIQRRYLQWKWEWQRRILGKDVPKPKTDYLDFQTAIRSRSDIKQTIQENLYDLIDRDILNWIDIARLLREHLDGRADHSMALTLLASLEIYYKSNTQ